MVEYEKNTNWVKCDFCDFVGDWEESDNVHGYLFECEKCGRIFCEDCFKRKKGIKNLNMIFEGRMPVLCPICF